MGETQTIEIAKRLASNERIKSICNISGTCYAASSKSFIPKDFLECESFSEVRNSKKAFAEAFALQYREHDHIRGHGIYQMHEERYLVQNPPAVPLSREQLDHFAELPYQRKSHPVYSSSGGIPCESEMEFSITHNRGCFGGCSFCSLAFHQGRYVTSRSEASILKEAELLTKKPNFKGYINDIGGPTANFRGPSCSGQKKNGLCRDRRCLGAKPCGNLKADHSEYLSIIRKVRSLPGVKKVFIRSGLRYDYLLLDKNSDFLEELIAHHISGQLRVAPEHCSGKVLDLMGKPSIGTYLKFKKKFYSLNERFKTNQYLVPYFISSHPGCTLHDAINLAVFLKKEGIRPDQVQDFYPTPGTVSTCMFHTGIDPFSGKKVHVPKESLEKATQRALLQYYLPGNRKTVIAVLKRCGREELIGYGPNCLVRPDPSTETDRRSLRKTKPEKNKPKK
jgi:uncharacterized radical SAM protein YgiQ